MRPYMAVPPEESGQADLSLLPGVNYVGGSRQLRWRVTPLPTPCHGRGWGLRKPGQRRGRHETWPSLLRVPAVVLRDS